MSVLSDNDIAQNLDLFKYYPDFDDNTQIWSRNILPYNEVSKQIATIDIETSGLDNKAPDACVVAVGIELNGNYFKWDIGYFEDMLDFWDQDKRFPAEKFMLEQVIKFLNNNSERIYILTGHNIFAFDIPYIMERCRFHGIRSGFNEAPGYYQSTTEVKNSMWHGKPIRFLNIVHPNFNIVDTLHLTSITDKSQGRLTSFGLKYVCGPDGYGLVDDRVEIDGDKILLAYFKEYDKFHQYLKDDVDTTKLLVNYLLPSFYYLLKYVPNVIIQDLIFKGNGQNWSAMIEKHYGFRPEPDQKTVYPGGFTGIKSGVFTNCFKLDYSSLYPYTMIHNRIHSRKDPDMYQLKVLSAIKKERLRLKALGQEGDKDAKLQEKALKVIINSGYGVLGTIGVPFNDMTAASRVTAFGRKALDYMISVVKSHGGIVVQADTDGIVVSHPDAKGLHQKVQDSLPDWLNVDLEDQYDWVWIYKRKNYITCANGKIKAVGIVRKREKSELMKRYFKYLPELYLKHGREGVEKFTDNLMKDLENRTIPIHLLAETKKMVDYSKKPDTKSQIQEDLKAKPGESVTFYRKEITEEYRTAKTNQLKTKTRIAYERIENFNNDYSVEYYKNEFLKVKWSEKAQKFTQEGYKWMFLNSIINPINETSSGKEL